MFIAAGNPNCISGFAEACAVLGTTKSQASVRFAAGERESGTDAIVGLRESISRASALVRTLTVPSSVPSCSRPLDDSALPASFLIERPGTEPGAAPSG
ncbi:MAG: hypothetical protein IPM01_14765 [Burkholderiaceae bacterium]|nr:hypothetical protein [Burkholderiaceae bacterium]